MIVHAETTVENGSTIDLSVETRISHSAGTLQLRLRDWTTNQFTTVGTFAINNADQVRSTSVNAGNFIGAGGEIDLSIKEIVFVPFVAFQFDAFIDHVTVEVN